MCVYTRVRVCVRVCGRGRLECMPVCVYVCVCIVCRYVCGCSEINAFIGGSTSTVWWAINSLKSNQNTKVNLPIFSLTKWKEYYQKERLEYTTQSPRVYQTQGTPIEITKQMIDKALDSLKNNRASGLEEEYQ